MKKILLLALCAISFLSFSNKANAQLLSGIEGMPPYKLGVTAGLNASTFTLSTADPILGFNVGVDLMLDASDLVRNTYLRANLLVSRKGGIDCLSYGELKADVNIRTVYIEIPVHYGYALRVTDGFALLGETGPYLAIGLGGNGHIPTPPVHYYNGKFFSSKYHGEKPKRFDLGWGFAVGAMFQSRHQVKVGYDFGFINLTERLLQNRNLMVNYSYFFE